MLELLRDGAAACALERFLLPRPAVWARPPLGLVSASDTQTQQTQTNQETNAMKTLLNTLLFAAMTLPAVAQRYDTAQLPTADHSSPKDPLVVVKPQAQNPSEEPVEAAAVPQEGGQFQVYLGASRMDHLELKMATELPGVPFLGLVIASTEDSRMEIPGLPLLLKTDIIVASGLADATLRFDMGPAKLPFSVFVQGIAVTDFGIGASGVIKIEPAE